MTFFSKFKYLAGRWTCCSSKIAKIQLNLAFEPKPNAVAEKFYLGNQPPTYLGKTKKNQNCHKSKNFQSRHNKKVQVLKAHPPW